jgi:beta-lactamase class A
MKKHLNLKETSTIRVSLFPAMLLISVLLIITYFLAKNSVNAGSVGQKMQTQQSAAITLNECNPKINVIRLHDFHLTQPLILGEFAEQSRLLQPLQNQIDNLIREKIKAGQLISASVFLRTFNNGNWFTVNGDETYIPGSLIKVAVMISYLKRAEQYKAILGKQLIYKKKNKAVPSQTYEPHALKEGNAYSVKELLQFMIVDSDNDATELLNENLDIPAFIKVFTDLGMTAPNVMDRNFQIKPSEYSRFFRVLYNASYLTPESSEFALQLLTKSTFEKGIIDRLPTNLIVAHKFGEASTPELKQLHESGIIYLADKPYVITIMTKGKTDVFLPAIIGDISNMAYEFLNNLKTATS